MLFRSREFAQLVGEVAIEHDGVAFADRVLRQRELAHELLDDVPAQHVVGVQRDAAHDGQFAGVEQSIATNKNLENLITLQTASQNAAATSYIGRTVESIGDKQPLKDGKATWGYAFDGTPSTVQIFIKDKDGTVVYQTTGETGAGKSILLDALDALLGGQGPRLLRQGSHQGVIEASF
mgnify:CR=1 FL=1